MEKPWLAHYENEVPHTIDYPKIPLHQMLEDSAAQVSRPDRLKLVLRYLGPLTLGGTLTYRQLLDRSTALPRRCTRSACARATGSR